ncbi:LOW QUALITY PROTEIN: hypothetical protein HID58_046498 [Brassica napus]|uniref:Uncharacterized protein n=1 Tax=Brassica napus TaxID=3708 RepID=A0ABQ8AWJ7_BRANA|nr:LOW QUALITY PROTEIN: hypothetical protein HID58_046498 [Brassica napus]
MCLVFRSVLLRRRLLFDCPFLGVLVRVSSVLSSPLGALSSSVASLTEGGGVYLFLRWWLVVVLEVWCWCRSSMVTPRRRCDLPPFQLVLFPARDSESIFEALSTGFFGLCSCAFWFDCSVVTGRNLRHLAMMLKAPCGLRVFLVSSVAPSGVAHIPVLWLPLGPRAVQVLVQRSTCSRLLAYRSWFGGHRVSKPLAGRGAFEDCIEGLGAIFNGIRHGNSRHLKQRGEPHVPVVNVEGENSVRFLRILKSI